MGSKNVPFLHYKYSTFFFFALFSGHILFTPTLFIFKVYSRIILSPSSNYYRKGMYKKIETSGKRFFTFGLPMRTVYYRGSI